ncbi:hypothetical protein [Acinetobacter sp. MB5]|uniref:hypothetical protein n=1 Tax=Acinetobacter sp. MB5 TaxID=2069438 RepID=UPI000DCF6FDE|nr:hypothetical protein [Acinetobacter sp. MB5]
MQFNSKWIGLLGCGLALHACIVVPEHTRQVESTTRVFVNSDAQDTQVDINRPQVIIIQQPDGYYRPHHPEYHVPPNCHLQSNGRSMGPIPMVCD